jgi:hypothetical protein
MKTASAREDSLLEIKEHLKSALEALKRSGTDEKDFHGASALKIIAEIQALIERELIRPKRLGLETDDHTPNVFDAIIANAKAIDIFGNI